MVARAIRNLLEDRQHHVLLLGLLQPFTDDEIFALLDTEVKAREWLVLIDTESSRNSAWVQFELKCAETHKKTVYQIAGDRFVGSDRYTVEQEVKPCVDTFSRGLRVFLSYSFRDSKDLARDIHEFLQTNGFESWLDQQSVIPASPWQQQIQRAIDETLERGVFIPIIGAGTVQSSFLLFELEYALDRGGLILPIIVDDVDFSLLPRALRSIQYLDMRNRDFKTRQMRELLQLLNNIRHKAFNETCGSIS
jgi:hypothetical protein